LIPRQEVLWHQPNQRELLFVTLNKSKSLLSPSGQRAIHHEARQAEPGVSPSRAAVEFPPQSAGRVRR